MKTFLKILRTIVIGILHLFKKTFFFVTDPPVWLVLSVGAGYLAGKYLPFALFPVDKYTASIISGLGTFFVLWALYFIAAVIAMAIATIASVAGAVAREKNMEPS